MFQNKVIAQKLYLVEIWGSDKKVIAQVEVIQSSFIKNILGFPKDTLTAYLMMEIGLLSLSIRIHLELLGHYEKLQSLQEAYLANLSFPLHSWESIIQIFVTHPTNREHGPWNR